MAERPILTVFGAGGTTGREVVRQGVEAGYQVRAVEHSWPVAEQGQEHVTPMTADVLKGDLAPAVEGAEAVISALGVGNDPITLIDPPPLYTEGTLRIVEAMKAGGARRLAVISASFVATFARGPLHFRAAATVALRQVVRQMADMERILRASDGIDWTAVRPGWLYEAPFTGDYTVTADVIPPDLIRTRHADLAHFLVRCVTEGGWIRQTPAIARAEPMEVSSPLAMLREMAGGLG